MPEESVRTTADTADTPACPEELCLWRVVAYYRDTTEVKDQSTDRERIQKEYDRYRELASRPNLCGVIGAALQKVVITVEESLHRRHGEAVSDDISKERGQLPEQSGEHSKTARSVPRRKTNAQDRR